MKARTLVLIGLGAVAAYLVARSTARPAPLPQQAAQPAGTGLSLNIGFNRIWTD